MKIAIVCDWLVSVGGAEKFLQHLLNCFPDSDLFAVIDYLPDNSRHLLGNKEVTTTFLQKMPFIKRYYRHCLPLMPLAIEQLDVSDYDIIISSSHAVAKGIITGPNQLHVSYVHSPMRYIWDLQHEYLHETGIDKKFYVWLVRYLLHKLRLWDVRSANGVDYFLANSHYIARRIQKTYRRSVNVLYPPIELERFTVSDVKDNYYLTASRLVPYKRVNLIVEAFNRLPDQQLVVIGDGPDYAKIKKIAKPNIKLLGYQPDHILIRYMQRARAFVFAAEEDFGLVPVEAQACGTPVIAYGRGGALETIRGIDHPNPTGLFFQQQTITEIINAITEFERLQIRFTASNCSENAARFHPEKFRCEMINFIQQKFQDFRQQRFQ